MIIFSTFGCEKYVRQVERITKEAMSSSFFDKIHTFSPSELSSEFISKHNNFLHGKGYGFWIWKPQIIKQLLSTINENDIIVYCDSGSTINAAGSKRFREYIDFAISHPSGVVAFSMPQHLEIQFTKRELLNQFSEDYAKTGQICATYFIVRKCKKSCELIEKWSEISQIYNLVDDSQWLSQYPAFIDHRWDQSIWSLLNKNYSTCIIPSDEGFPPHKDFPFWGTRIRT